MELIVLLMIVGIFGVWVYGLKQEIASLQKRLPAEKHSAASDAPRSAAVPVASHISTKPIERDGVQTWVLE